MAHGHDCPDCYYLGEDHCGHDHFICHQSATYPVLVRESVCSTHVTSMQVYLQSRGLEDVWAKDNVTVHEWGVMQLENQMGCRFGASRVAMGKKYWDVRDPRLCNDHRDVV